MRVPLEPAVQVNDVRALRALAHPLRNRLLGLLRLDGPSTATLLGKRLVESSGSTSYTCGSSRRTASSRSCPTTGTGGSAGGGHGPG